MKLMASAKYFFAPFFNWETQSPCKPTSRNCTQKALTAACDRKRAMGLYTKANLSWRKQTASQIIYVCRNMATCLLGKPAIKALDMLKFSTESELSCCSLGSQEGQNILNECPEIFRGLGNIKGAPIHIEI